MKATLSAEKAQLEQKLTAAKQGIEQLQVEKVCNSMNENHFHAQFPWNDQINCTIFGAMRNKCCFGGL